MNKNNFSYRVAPFVVLMLFISGCDLSSVAQGNSSNIQMEKCGDNKGKNEIKAPDFKVNKVLGSEFQIGNQINWNVDEKLKSRYNATFQGVEKTAASFGNKKSGPLVVQVRLIGENAVEATNLPQAVKDKRDLYRLVIKEDKVNIMAIDGAGIVNALASLESLIVQGKGSLTSANITDWPDHDLRVFQIVIRNLTTDVAKAAIDKVRRGHYNSLGIDLSNNVRFPSINRLHTDCAWSVEEFVDVVQYARESGMEVIPGLRFLTHQNKDLFVPGTYPELMYNERTYDPRKQEVYDIIFPYIDEVIAAVSPEAISIGHDEVYGVSGKHAGAEDALPADLFKLSIVKIHEYLKGKNVKTWIAGDMLITPEEFPEMHPGPMNATAEYRAIRKELPKDILICDWHYRNPNNNTDKSLVFPSLNMFMDEGFEVVGATFKDPYVTREFSRYAYEQKNQKMQGMTATTWSFIRKGAQNGDWKDFDEVLGFSAEAFWNATDTTNPQMRP